MTMNVIMLEYLKLFNPVLILISPYIYFVVYFHQLTKQITVCRSTLNINRILVFLFHKSTLVKSMQIYTYIYIYSLYFQFSKHSINRILAFRANFVLFMNPKYHFNSKQINSLYFQSLKNLISFIPIQNAANLKFWLSQLARFGWPEI